jgi:hypothetical protein
MPLNKPLESKSREAMNLPTSSDHYLYTPEA